MGCASSETVHHVMIYVIDSEATDHFFSNRAYLSTYDEYHHEFQTGSGEVLETQGYLDDVVRLAHLDGSEVI